MNIAIISGASSGIGLEIVKELDKLCLDELWLISSSKDKLLLASENLTTKARILPLDLSNDEYISTLSKLLTDEKPSVKFLVCSVY
jgi:short-subunit dehydrogenase